MEVKCLLEGLVSNLLGNQSSGKCKFRRIIICVDPCGASSGEPIGCQLASVGTTLRRRDSYRPRDHSRTALVTSLILDKLTH